MRKTVTLLGRHGPGRRDHGVVDGRAGAGRPDHRHGGQDRRHQWFNRHGGEASSSMPEDTGAKTPSRFGPAQGRSAAAGGADRGHDRPGRRRAGGRTVSPEALSRCWAARWSRASPVITHEGGGPERNTHYGTSKPSRQRGTSAPTLDGTARGPAWAARAEYAVFVGSLTSQTHRPVGSGAGAIA